MAVDCPIMNPLLPDDCIAIKSGKDLDGRAVGIPSNSILVEHMTFGTGHGITIGSEMSGNVTNVVFRNSTCNGTQTGARVKTMRGRGGIVEVVQIDYTASLRKMPRRT